MNIENYNKYRIENIKNKRGAVWVSILELDGIINLSKVARKYFNRSQGWISQRINGCTVEKKAMAFKPDEYQTIVNTYRDIAAQLLKAADEIEKAAND